MLFRLAYAGDLEKTVSVLYSTVWGGGLVSIFLPELNNLPGQLTRSMHTPSVYCAVFSYLPRCTAAHSSSLDPTDFSSFSFLHLNVLYVPFADILYTTIYTILSLFTVLYLPQILLLSI